MAVKKSKITHSDIEYFVSTIIDYLGDFDDFSQSLDSLTNQETTRLYEVIEGELEKRLERELGRSFDSPEEKDKWIVVQIDGLRGEVVKDAKGFLAKGSSS